VEEDDEAEEEEAEDEGTVGRVGRVQMLSSASGEDDCVEDSIEVVDAILDDDDADDEDS
jgi:hypothetical protein